MKSLFIMLSSLIAFQAQADLRAYLFVQERVQPYDSVQITDRSGLQLEDRQGHIVSSPVPFGVEDMVATEIIAVPTESPQIPIQPVIAGSLTVDFATNSANLSWAERQKLQNFLSQLENTNVRGIKIAGFADPRGNANYNQMLSGKRARNVAKLLENKGVDEGMITVEAGGEVAAANLSDSRIVEIVVTR